MNSFVSLSATHDTMSQKLQFNKIYIIISDVKFTCLNWNMLSKRRYLVELNDKKAIEGISRMVFHKVVCYHLYYLTFTQMTHQYAKHAEVYLRRWLVYCDTGCII